jgi:protein-S-isoprenylcysteine O-methyltransferase Ste14
MGELNSEGQRTDLGPVILRRAGQLLVTVLLQAAVLFITAWRLDWWQGWLYLGLQVGSIAINSAILLRTNPQTIASRASTEGVKDWDRVIGTLISVIYLGGILGVAGLDARFGWTRALLPALVVAAVVLFMLGAALVAWTMATNKFFSGMVRIQEKEGHVVVTGGPYRYVRHPGYVAFIINMTSTALVLGSTRALVGTGVLLVLLIVRTAFEDRMLHEELAGYREYAREVRFRLVPGIW